MSSSYGLTTTTSPGATSLSSLDHLPPSQQLCYVHCSRCDTVLGVSVPTSSSFKAVTVRCGHCGSLLPLNIQALLLPTSTNQFNMVHNNHNLFSTPFHNHMGEVSNPGPNYSNNQPNAASNCLTPFSNRSSPNDLPKPPAANRPPEKRQRAPSAYNRFIKDEIQRIKGRNPDISHKEAFSAAAKNWAHFPHIHFGLMADQTVKRTSNMRPHHPQVFLLVLFIVNAIYFVVIITYLANPSSFSVF